MSTTGSEQERAAALERLAPLLEAGAEPPGRWITNERGKTWKGKLHWRTRNGQAVVMWSLGEPSSIEAARYPDGTRGEARRVLDFGWRRRAIGDRRWIYGSIEIRPDDAIFTDGPQPTYVPPPRGGEPNLEADLAADAQFLAALRDDRFADVVYKVFRNRTFVRVNNGGTFSLGDREAARLVRDLRGMGESYQDWFPHSHIEGIYPDDRADHVAQLQGTIAALSQPLETVEKSLPPSVPQGARDTILRHFRGELEGQGPARENWEKERQKMLASTQRALAALDANAAVFESLRTHLARLGWRTENEIDRKRARRTEINRQLKILDELKTLGLRPDAPRAEWAEQIRQSRFGGRLIALSSDGQSQMSDEEREVLTGGLQRRLRELAISGRISRSEYDDLKSRIGPW
jgi:hypothetical protein